MQDATALRGSRSPSWRLLYASLLLACVGEVAPATDPPPAEGPRPAPGAEPPASAAPAAGRRCTGAADVPGTPLARLTKLQYLNTLRDLLGPAIAARLERAADQLPEESLARLLTVGADPVGELHMGTYFAVGKLAGSLVAQDDQAILRFGQPCMLAAAPPSADCLAGFLGRLGERAFRRPLSAEQRDGLLRLLGARGDLREGVALVVAAVLQSPGFLYRVETGSAAAGLAPGALALDSFELAARLSYGLWDTMPDEALFELARKGDLRRPEVLAAQVSGMVGDPRARTKLRAFFASWLALDAVPEITRDRARLAGADPQKLREDMMAELDRFIDHVVWGRRGGVADLLTSRDSLARSPALAALYGHAPAPASGPAEMEEGRRGLLGRAPFLLAADGESHPIHRGAFIRRRLLCDSLALPDIDVAAEGPNVDTPEMRRMYSTRERVMLKTSGAACVGCHTIVNPTAFPLEVFDGVGRRRTEEIVTDAKGAIVARHAIDPAAEVRGLDGQTATVRSPAELAERLAATAAVGACVGRQLFRFYQARPETEIDRCALDEIAAASTGREASILRGLEATFKSAQTTLVRTP